ncbi:MAG: DegT/DnrJ/EryC1/StrS family aminotransferase, partial [Magnetospirillum sp.]|nr:DegT/DnrJ/EryC1/StrS family aminotransferase [Magnetospirillum sp.]
HLAALALDLGPGDAVLVPTMTFLATANAARYVGAEVVFADVDADTGLLTPATLAEALTRCGSLRPRAVFPVHLAGQPCDMAGIGALAAAHGLAVVEDACHALGGEDRGVPIGSCPDSRAACFSLHPVKAVAMGEGGVVTTNDAALARRLTRLRSHGMTRDPAEFVNADLAFAADGSANPWYYEMAETGFNYRASDINCALGLSQLAKLDRFLARRRDLADRYDRLLAPLAPAIRPIPRTAWGKSGWHLYPVLIDFERPGPSRAAVMNDLRTAGIGTQVHYIPVHGQPPYRKRYGDLALPGASAYYRRNLSLPLYPGMTDSDTERVVAALYTAIRPHPG